MAGLYYNKDFIKNKDYENGISIQAAVASLQLYYSLCYNEELRQYVAFKFFFFKVSYVLFTYNCQYS